MNFKRIALCTIMIIGIGAVSVMAGAKSTGKDFILNKTAIRGYEQIDSLGKGYASTTVKATTDDYKDAKPTVGANLYNASGNIVDYDYKQGSSSGINAVVYTRYLADLSSKDVTGISSKHSTQYHIDESVSLPYLSRP
ncbi:hypothetical protein [Clostridium tetani]|uniref:hypothetical protein n=1 Tax=Clostridium tetani TaxID=1513 RepID=UPI00100BD5CF|nr:hypothetical protein [Clostridium tetani]RXM73484.1 hypothetical protein DP143_05075 [Clostridium tetani]